MKRWTFWIALIVLMALHHDWWFWTDGTLLFDFLPIGLGYHALISLAAGALWAWAVFDVMSHFFVDDSATGAESNPKHGH